jgi:hypothetical protein
MRRILQDSVAGFHSCLQWPDPWRDVMDDVLMAQVWVSFIASGGTYVALRIECELRAEGLATCSKRLARLIRPDGLVARTAL